MHHDDAVKAQQRWWRSTIHDGCCCREGINEMILIAWQQKETVWVIPHSLGGIYRATAYDDNKANTYSDVSSCCIFQFIRHFRLRQQPAVTHSQNIYMLQQYNIIHVCHIKLFSQPYIYIYKYSSLDINYTSSKSCEKKFDSNNTVSFKQRKPLLCSHRVSGIL